MSNSQIQIYTDSAENSVRKTVNGYGKLAKFNNGGYRVAVVVINEDGSKKRGLFYNTQCPDQFAGECFSVLKAVDAAKELGLKSIVIKNDRIGSFKASTKKGYIGAKYLWVASKIATENGIEVEFETVSSADNLADGLSRAQDVPQGWLPDAPTLTAAIKALKPSPIPTAPATPVENVPHASRGADHDEWFASHQNEWPAMRDAWKAEGLSSRARDEKLTLTIRAWVNAGRPAPAIA